MKPPQRGNNTFTLVQAGNSISDNYSLARKNKHVLSINTSTPNTHFHISLFCLRLRITLYHTSPSVPHLSLPTLLKQKLNVIIYHASLNTYMVFDMESMKACLPTKWCKMNKKVWFQIIQLKLLSSVYLLFWNRISEYWRKNKHLFVKKQLATDLERITVSMSPFTYISKASLKQFSSLHTTMFQSILVEHIL